MTSPHRDSVDDCLRRVFGGLRWLVVGDVLQGAVRRAQGLSALGAESCFAIGARMGAGALPESSATLSWHCLGLGPGEHMMHAIRTADAALADLPEPARQALEVFDPQRIAQAVGMIFSTGAPVAGRSMFGARPAAWQALEDKVTIDALWDRVGVERAPSEVVSVDPETLASATAKLDHGDGVVWAGDAREGFNGGASYTWRVADADDAAAALEFLGSRCDRVRVMPFLQGVPCSIHGVVFDAHVVVLRPAEMVVVQHPGPHGFRYMRAATFWDPPVADRTQMRQIAKVVGAHLRDTLGYRGAFTLDGVLTATGFRPTELNPRVGAALGLMVPGFPTDLLSYALVEGRVSGVDPVGLERELLHAADAQRAGSLALLAPTAPPDDCTPRPLVWAQGVWRDARDDETPDAELTVGEGATGMYMSLSLDPKRTPVGESVGPRATALVAYADAHLGTSLGPVTAAVDVRRRSVVAP